jgi:hypothetical protein
LEGQKKGTPGKEKKKEEEGENAESPYARRCIGREEKNPDQKLRT